MNLEEIKAAVDAELTVNWKSDEYEVRGNDADGYLIVCTLNDSAIGLTWDDGATMNGTTADFFLADKDLDAAPAAEESLTIESIASELVAEMGDIFYDYNPLAGESDPRDQALVTAVTILDKYYGSGEAKQ